ncbi:MAG: hypothetical protein AB7O96_11825 [Pseudobdellovibrionaceae bacterium]
MALLAELHCHSTFSDGKMSIPELVDFYGGKTFQVLSITDHICENNSIIGAAAQFLRYTLSPSTFPIYQAILKSEVERAWDQYRMILLPGIEVSKNSLSNHRSAHILGIGTSDYVSAELEVTDILKAIRSQGALTAAAHPVSTRRFEKQTYHLWDRKEELKDLMDVWEVASGPVIFKEVQDSGLPIIATSDLHIPEQINSWKTLIESELHPEAILENIKKQNVKPIFYKDCDQNGSLLSILPMGNSSVLHRLGNKTYA